MRFALALLVGSFLLSASARAEKASRPHIVLVMTDDQGYGQTGFMGHPLLKTPNLDAMAENGLVLDRFYAGAPNCSPTRATVLTGRSNDRTGVQNHGYALALQERTIAQALNEAGYATGHFGKWHLNGMRGPGAPILASDDHHPGHFGFEHWLSVTNFFDRNPILSRMGTFEEHEGDSSVIVTQEAAKWLTAEAAKGRPTFSVIWYGSPHSPFVAADEDKAGFSELSKGAQDHYGELVAVDRAVGMLRDALEEADLTENTLLWFNSDNGGLPGIKPGTVGGLRGFKNSVYEGGLRVPCVIEWPSIIKRGRRSASLAGTVDIFPTIVDVCGLKESAMLPVVDGESLLPLFKGEDFARERPLFFRHTGRSAVVDGGWKLLTQKRSGEKYELYNLADDPTESRNLFGDEREQAARLSKQLTEWNASVERSIRGEDYPSGTVDRSESAPKTWTKLPEYQKYLPEWKERPEFRRYIK